MNYYLRRTVRIPLTILAVATFTFGLIRLLPGGPFTQLRIQLIRQGVPAEQVNARIEALQNIRPDAPLWQQYLDYLIGVAQLDLGRSISLNAPVIEILARALPWTVFLVVTSTVLMFVIGVLIGAIQAYKEGSRFDKVASGSSIFLMAVPYYIFAVLFLFFLSFQLNLFPTGNAVERGIEASLSAEYFLSVLHHAALPIIAFTIGGVGSTALNMRGNGIQVLGEEYVEVARLRGLPDSRIATKYVAKNAILPMYTGLLLLIGFRLGGTVVLEQIFSYPGLGYYLISAVNANDYPLMMGCFLVITVTLVIAVYIADLTYGLIDPRISAGDSDGY
ncbi:peptide/nickel transport system permease protein [Halogranum rubrum]|uniref:Peptide/nickel transport system permease protein n=2 Tax=Halogranum rubrum TaxID=553466 RepID=A0A1I4HP13_9EURY|nr:MULTISPECIES: ABC transporter permease [Halogranum]EJN57742.1 ABC-type dipeptide/oligopeptide/nickel transport system, permease component [Halogranum salarium B-1]SFL43834.1 peptide/nickel transport system permease protein [Halogranum rubrum]